MLEICKQGIRDRYNISMDVLSWTKPRESEAAQTNHTTEQDSTVIYTDSQYSKTRAYFVVILPKSSSLGC